MDVRYFESQAKAILEKIISWRRSLHQIPEIGFDLFKTAAFIKKELDALKIPYQVMAQTGLVALIDSGKPGPTLALRADMDALPITEETGLSFAAKNNNMHACGHDAHMAMLLGTARLLKENRAAFKGAVKLIFQPGEEGYRGAQKMIDEGCLKSPTVDAIFGLHVGQIFPELSLGQIGVCAGPIMASATAFSVTIKGKSTHGAYPHLGTDSITACAQVINALQQVISRHSDPLEPVVLTIGKISGGTAINIVAPSTKLSGDFRTVSKDTQRDMIEDVKKVSRLTAEALGAQAEVKVLSALPVTVNDPHLAEKVARVAREMLGEKNVVPISKPSMGAEDMSLYLEKVPGAYFMLGTSNPAQGINHPHHSDRFDVDETVLWIGPALFASLAADFLG